MRPNNTRPRTMRIPRAVALAEALLASVILAIVVAAVTQAVVAGQMQAYDAIHRSRGVHLAEALMDEVLRLPYDDPDGASAPGPEAGENGRANFDNVDDYHGFSQAAGNLSDLAGLTYGTPYQVFTHSITVVAGTVTVTGFGNPLPGQTATVTVQDAAGTTWVVEHFVPEPPA